MAKKTQVNEKQEKLNEKGVFTPEPVQPPRGPDASVGAATLHPHTNDAPDPKAELSFMQRVIGALGAIDTRWEDNTNSALADMANLTSTGGGVPGDGHAVDVNQGSIKMKASAAVGSVSNEELEKIFDAQEGLSEDFRSKTKTLFEAALEARMIIERENFEEEKKQLEEEHTKQLTEEVQQITEELTEAVGGYVDYAAQEWLKENEVAIESSLRNEIAGDLLEGLRQLFLQNNITVPEEHVDVVDAMSEKIDELEKRLADQIGENAELKKNVEATAKREVATKVAEGLTVDQKEKLEQLAENIEWETAEEFEKKLVTIKQSNFLKEPKKSTITEALEDVNPDAEEVPTKPVSNEMKPFVDAIARQARLKYGKLSDGKTN